MGNTVDGDDNLVLQCRIDGRMIPIVYGGQSAGRSETKKIRPAVAKSLPSFYFETLQFSDYTPTCW